MVNEQSFVASCKELANQNNFPQRSIAPDNTEYKELREKKKQAQKDQDAKDGIGEKKAKSKIQKDDSELMLK
mgnify:FL=1|jgi:hypothetical protein